MAIRFQCAGCSQPIEVDDEWAQRLVRCPYCAATVTAPAESTLVESDTIPEARTVPRPETAGGPGTGPEGWTAVPRAAAPPGQRNGPAIAAIILAILSLLLFLAGSMVLSSHMMEMESYLDPEGTMAEQQAGVQRMISDYGGQLPGWMIGFSLLVLASLAAWLAAVICGIVGAVRPQRREMAYIALGLSTILPMLMCIGFLVG